MPAQDVSRIKEKIINFLRIRGPSLPVHIAKEIQMTMLFASAFLSELLSEKKIKLSNMRVGSSPLYLIPGQENRLESFSNFLKSKEKEAFILLKEKKFLADKIQEPAIRVALRSIRDFAIPFKYHDEIYWRYFTISEEEFKIKETPKIESPIIKIEKQDLQKSEAQISQVIYESARNEKEVTANSFEQEELNIFDKPKKTEKKQKTKNKIRKPQKTKKDDKFFDKVKESLQKKSIEILSIDGFSKDELILKIRENNEEKILFAFNKKKINEEDIIKISKKIPENIKYSVLCLGEPLKRLTDFLDSIKNLSDIKKIE